MRNCDKLMSETFAITHQDECESDVLYVHKHKMTSFTKSRLCQLPSDGVRKKFNFCTTTVRINQLFGVL